MLLDERAKTTQYDTNHPERFNQDKTPRLIRFFDSSKGPMKGTADEGTHTEKDSRQVRRYKIFKFLFSHISHDPTFGKLPRANRRYWAHNTVMPENPNESVQKPSV